MGVYVFDMEMPKNCGACLLRASCFHRIYLERRPAYCPLVYVPPHGRLIDADALSSKLTDLAENEWNQRTGTTWAGAFEDVDGFVQDAPTIIPADQAEEGET